MAGLTYLVIGANRGLGLEFVRQISAKPDCIVLATARDPPTATELNSLALASPDRIKVFTLDFTSNSSFSALLPVLPPFTRLIINAGVNLSRSPLLSPTEDMLSDLASTFAVNVLGPLRAIRELAPSLLKEGGGKVMLTSSSFASLKNAEHGMSPGYSVSKAALNMMGRKLSIELKPKGVDVIIMDPGWNKTDMGGEDAPLDPKDTIKGMLEVIETAESGIYVKWDGTKGEW